MNFQLLCGVSQCNQPSIPLPLYAFPLCITFGPLAIFVCACWMIIYVCACICSLFIVVLCPWDSIWHMISVKRFLILNTRSSQMICRYLLHTKVYIKGKTFSRGDKKWNRNKLNDRWWFFETICEKSEAEFQCEPRTWALDWQETSRRQELYCVEEFILLRIRFLDLSSFQRPTAFLGPRPLPLSSKPAEQHLWISFCPTLLRHHVSCSDCTSCLLFPARTLLITLGLLGWSPTLRSLA